MRYRSEKKVMLKTNFPVKGSYSDNILQKIIGWIIFFQITIFHLPSQVTLTVTYARIPDTDIIHATERQNNQWHK